METADVVTYPDYIRIAERKIGGWSIKKGKLIYRRLPLASADMEDTKLMYGVSSEEMVLELFRVNGGKAGYYIADLRNKAYYYSGERWKDVKKQLIEMGIGRHDPMS
jgi:hypothetical protein